MLLLDCISVLLVIRVINVIVDFAAVAVVALPFFVVAALPAPRAITTPPLAACLDSQVSTGDVCGRFACVVALWDLSGHGHFQAKHSASSLPLSAWCVAISASLLHLHIVSP